jgi:hypothetical protein
MHQRELDDFWRKYELYDWNNEQEIYEIKSSSARAWRSWRAGRQIGSGIWNLRGKWRKLLRLNSITLWKRMKRWSNNTMRQLREVEWWEESMNWQGIFSGAIKDARAPSFNCRASIHTRGKGIYQNWTELRNCNIERNLEVERNQFQITPKDCGQGEICCRYIFGNIEIWSRITEEGKTYYEERTENLTIGRSGVARVNPTYSSDDEDFDDRGLMSIWNG